MNAQSLAYLIKQQGYTLADAAKMRPNDIIEGVLQLKRGTERRVLVLERMTAAEAALRFAEVRDDGWQPKRWLRIGPAKPITHSVRLRRAIA